MFCEKCGNKIKEGYKFCDKCGTEVKKPKKVEEEKEVKKVEKEVETKKIEEKNINSEQTNPVVNQPVKKKEKKGKGKVVLLTILNLILLATTILFLVLWLIKPSNSKCENSSSNNYSNTTDEKKDDKKATKESSIVGKWEQNVDYKQGDNVVSRTYGMIELKSDGTFNSVFYDKDDMSNSERLNGTYTSSGNTVYISYYEDGENKSSTLYIEDDKMCINKRDCEDYLVKDSYNNKVVVYQDTKKTSSIEYIDYDDYKKILSEKRNAIVVVVHEGCYYCELFESVVEEIVNNYFTPVYYYEIDNNLDVSGTPTTFIIKNGEVVDSIVGYKEYSKVEEILEDNFIF